MYLDWEYISSLGDTCSQFKSKDLLLTIPAPQESFVSSSFDHTRSQRVNAFASPPFTF